MTDEQADFDDIRFSSPLQRRQTYYESMQNQNKNLGFQEKLDLLLATAFNKWGIILARNPCKIFWISLFLMLGLSSGLMQYKRFDDDILIWTPKNNPSVQAFNKSQALFSQDGGYIGVIAEVKGDSENVITLNAFKEMN